MVSLYFGNMLLRPETQGYVLDTDIGHPLQGAPGMVTLWLREEMVEGRYLGYHSPKACVPQYLAAVGELLQTYRERSKGEGVLVRCHSWTSGIGRVLLSDIMRLVQPAKVTEYHSSEPVYAFLSKLTSTFLPTQYPFPGKVVLSQVAIEPRKISDYKQLRTATLGRCIGTSSLPAQSPWVGQLDRLRIFVNNTQVESQVLVEQIGRICGLSTASKRCLGLGLLRDINSETGLVWVLTALEELGQVEVLEMVTGEGALELDWEPLDSLAAPYFLQGALSTQTRQKFHPNRNYS